MKKEIEIMKKTIAILILLIISFQYGCSKSKDVEKEKDYDIFIFTAYDDASGIWTIVRDNIYEHTKTEIKAVCDAYKFDKGSEFVRGKNACDKHVGSKVSIHALPKNPYDFAIVTFESDSLYFVEGKQGDRVFNSFKVISSRLLTY